VKQPEFLFFHVRVVRRKLGKGLEWIPYRWELVGKDDAIITGGIPTKRKTRGPRKGDWDWTGVQAERCVVTQSEFQAEMSAYEAESGKCSHCFGDAREWCGWSLAEGTKWRPCSRCGATGEAPLTPEQKAKILGSMQESLRKIAEPSTR